MQQTEEMAGMDGAERRRVEAVVETLATLGSRGESVAEVAHDARNMVTALGLYCDLLEEPGVLANPFTHYGNELRLVAAASRRLVEKLVSLDTNRSSSFDASLDAMLHTNLNKRLTTTLDSSIETSLDTRATGKMASRFIGPVTAGRSPLAAGAGNLLQRGRPESKRHEAPGRWDLMPAAPIENLAAELFANHNLLAALAGPGITLTVDVEGGARPVRMTGEDLTRVLVNMVKNAAEAMPAGGRIQIALEERPATPGTAKAMALTIEDNGPGIPEKALEEVFESGYSTRVKGTEARGSWPSTHRGLGLSISRSMVEAAGGRIFVTNSPHSGARFEIELPVRTR
jgi:signal transduction histidine kinase